MGRADNVFDPVDAVISGTTRRGVIGQIDIHARCRVVIGHGIDVTTAMDNVVAFTTAKRIVTLPADQRIVAFGTIKDIAAITTIKIVVTRAAIKIVVAKLAIDAVITFVGPKRIVAAAAIDGDIAIGNRIAGQIDNVVAFACVDDFDPVKARAIGDGFFNHRIKGDGTHEIVAAVTTR